MRVWWRVRQRHTAAGLGDRLGADERRQDIRGKENYFVMAMDLATRFILAWEVSPTKMDYGATKLLQAAKATYVCLGRVWLGYLVFCYPPMVSRQFHV